MVCVELESGNPGHRTAPGKGAHVHLWCDFLFRCVPLECILDAELPSDLGKLSDEMLENLRHFRDKHAGDPEGSIVCCDLTRAPGKKLAPVSRNGVCPTLTTRNLHVFVFQCKTNKYQRFLTARQRLILQGFDPEPIMQSIPDRQRDGRAHDRVLPL